MAPVLLLALLGVAVAETTVVSLFIPDADPQPLVASVLGKGSGTTTYSINCPSGTDGSDCGMGPGLYLTSGPTTVEWAMSEPADSFSGRVVCSLGGTTTAICTEMMGGTGANFPGTTTTTLAQSDITLLPVTITADPATSALTASSASSTSDVPTTNHRANVQSNPSTTTTTSILNSGTSTGGLPQMTALPVLAFGGAAVALVAVAL